MHCVISILHNNTCALISPCVRLSVLRVFISRNKTVQSSNRILVTGNNYARKNDDYPSRAIPTGPSIRRRIRPAGTTIELNASAINMSADDLFSRSSIDTNSGRRRRRRRRRFVLPQNVLSPPTSQSAEPPPPPPRLVRIRTTINSDERITRNDVDQSVGGASINRLGDRLVTARQAEEYNVDDSRDMRVIEYTSAERMIIEGRQINRPQA